MVQNQNNERYEEQNQMDDRSEHKMDLATAVVSCCGIVCGSLVALKLIDKTPEILDKLETVKVGYKGVSCEVDCKDKGNQSSLASTEWEHVAVISDDTTEPDEAA